MHSTLRHGSALPLLVALMMMTALLLPGSTTQAVPLSLQVFATSSVASSGDQVITSDGRFIAFESSGSDFVSGDTNANRDIFVVDTMTGVYERISMDSDGNQANDESRYPSISADGRYVAFESFATNLVPNDTNETWDVFVHDRQTGTTQRISVDSNGNQANDESGGLLSGGPSISADGRYVAFESEATNLVPNDTTWDRDVFVHDRQTGTTQRVSVDSDGNQANGSSSHPSISADGRYVAFGSFATNLVSNDTNADRDVFVHDRQTGTTQRVSVDSNGNQANGVSRHSSISADGRYVAFGSEARNLVPEDTTWDEDIFVYDRQTATTERVSIDSNGNEANGSSARPSISADGRYVAFDSGASNLVPEDINEKRDVFVYDRMTQILNIASRRTDGIPSNGRSYYGSVSNMGNVVFESTATSLSPQDTDSASDIYLAIFDSSSIGTPPTITSTPPPDGQVNAAYTYTLTATGDTPITYAVTEGALPPGLTLSDNTISGTPTTAGTYTGVITATNDDGNDTQAFSITISEVTGDLTQIAPALNSIISDDTGRPAFSWVDSGASSYEIYVHNPPANSIIVYESISDAVCNAGTCEIVLTDINADYILYAGVYTWYVREAPNGTWVGPASFTLQAQPPALVSPLSATETDTYTPIFNWTLENNATNATHFNLYLAGSDGSVPINGWYTRTDVCGSPDAVSCAFTSPVALADGVEYTLYVQSYGPGGISIGGEFGNGYIGFIPFTVDVPKPVLVAPSADAVLTDNTLHGHGDFAFEWTGVENALGYELYIARDGALFFYDAVTCASNTDCSVDLTTVSEDYRMYNGAYTWYMRSQYADSTWSPWAGPMNFTLDVDPPAFVSPSSATNINSYTPMFNWTLENTATNATYFNLYLAGSDGSVPINGWYSRTDTCGSVDAVSCVFESPVALTDSIEYTLYIQSYGAGGISTGGEFGNGYVGFTPFTINVPKPVLGTPNTTITSGFGDPDFTWTGVAGATGYELYVARDGIQFFYQTVTCSSEPNCSVNLASISENYRLTNSAYSWYVRARYADASWSPWAGPVNFTVSIPPAALVTPADPTNATSLRPTFNWTLEGSAATDVMYFQLVIGVSDGTTLLDTTTWTIRSDLCGTMTGTSCAFTPSFDLTPGLDYKLYVQSYSIGGISTGGEFGNGYIAVGTVTPETPVP